MEVCPWCHVHEQMLTTPRACSESPTLIKVILYAITSSKTCEKTKVIATNHTIL